MAKPGISSQLVPTYQEEALLRWLRRKEWEEGLSAGMMVLGVTNTLQSIDAGRGKTPFLARLAELATMGSARHQFLVRRSFAVAFVLALVVACCLLSYVGGTLLVITNGH